MPDVLGEFIEALERVLLEGLNPCPLDAYVVLLDKLFVATERPSDAALTTWREHLSLVPEVVLERACMRLASTHKWAGAPKIAALTEAIDVDSAWSDLLTIKLRMRILKAAYARQQASKVPAVPYNPDIQTVVQAAAYASQRHRAKRIEDEHATRKAERKATYKMPADEEAKLNAVARAKVGLEP